MNSRNVEIYKRPIKNAAIWLATLLAIYSVIVGEYGMTPDSVCCTHKRQKKKNKHGPVLLQFEPLVDSDRSNYKYSQFKDDGRFGLLLN